MFDGVLVANRGEIARRIIRTLQRLAIRSIAIHTATDRAAPHVADADAAVQVASYLDIASVIAACRSADAAALHPGYGFLAENPALARACAAAGVTFVGPSPEATELLGDKVRAKAAARAAGVPVVPGYSEAEARADARYPLLVKAAAGGGGRGMRIVERLEDLEEALRSARREAAAGFGDDRVFIERFMPRARHIEVQVIADAHGTVLHLAERECSLQRRHQKVIEEAPSPVVSPALRELLGAEAVALIRGAGYVNAATVEFIADADDPEDHHFLEVNTRLQVEHPVTELVCGIDLVELQLRVAAGEPLGLAQDDVRVNGHAIEARVCAEDAARDFLPAAGRVLAYDRPGGPGVRVDDGIEVGSVVDTSYDSLLAKVIVHGADRGAALRRLERALSRTSILGVTTTTGFLRALLADDAVRAGDLDTGLVGRRAQLARPLGDEDVAVAAGMLMLAQRGAEDDDTFARTDGWRLSGARAASHWRLAVGAGRPVSVTVSPEQAAMVHPLGAGRFAVEGRGEWQLVADGELTWIGHAGWAWPVRAAPATAAGKTSTDGDLRAPLPGQVLLVPAAVGDAVATGDPIVVLESMKMELVIAAPLDGTVAELAVAVGDRVAVDQPLARVQAAAGR